MSENRAKEAGDWIARRDRGLSQAESAELQAWLDADPRNASEFQQMSGAWGKLDGLLAQAKAERIALVEEVPIRNGLVRIGAPLLAAAAIAVAFVLLREPKLPPSPPVAGIAAPAQIGSRQSYKVERTAGLEVLPDGTVVDLRGDSRVETDFSNGIRRVNLTGEAFFSVAKDPSRPFLVSAGGFTVRAVGTAFDVRVGPDQSQVILTEGKVRIESSTPGATAAEGTGSLLAPGQRATFDRGHAGAAVDTPTSAEIAQALAWRATMLTFDDTPWNEVVAAFNRFNSRKLKLADDSLKGQSFGGPVRADNLDGFLRLLRQGKDIDYEDNGTDLILIKSAR